MKINIDKIYIYQFTDNEIAALYMFIVNAVGAGVEFTDPNDKDIIRAFCELFEDVKESSV